MQQKDSENVNFLDDDLVLMDDLPDVKRKIKRAFCEPNNVNFNPPLSLAIALALGLDNQLELQKVYTSRDSLVDAFASGEIHPSELKPAVTMVVQDYYKRLVNLSKSEPFKTSKAHLLQYEKKVRKAKK